MAPDNEITTRLGDWTPPQQYNRPHLEPEGDTRTKEHKVLGDVSVVQVLGEEAERFSLRGDAYAEDIKTLREMRNEEVRLRHPVHSGRVYVLRVTASHTSEWDEDGWTYTYTIDMAEVT